MYIVFYNLHDKFRNLAVYLLQLMKKKEMQKKSIIPIQLRNFISLLGLLMNFKFI